MRVRMLISVSGTRSGVDWPLAGSVLDVDADEARNLITAGIAVVEPEPQPQVETRPAPTADVEMRRGPGRPRKLQP